MSTRIILLAGILLFCFNLNIFADIRIYPDESEENVTIPTVFKWHTAENAIWYYLVVCETKSSAKTVFYKWGITDTTITVSNLEPNTTYYWRLQPSNAEQKFPWLDYWEFKTGSGRSEQCFISIPDTQIIEQSQFSIPVYLNHSGLADVYSFQIEIIYDQSVIEPIKFSALSTFTTSINFQGDFQTPGIIKLGGYTTFPFFPGNKIITITFQSVSSRMSYSDLILQNAFFNNITVSELQNGKVTLFFNSKVYRNSFPQKFYLSPAYPNPFNQNVCIQFRLPGKEKNARIKIINIQGQTVTSEMICNRHNEMQYQWNGRDDFGQLVPKGTYFIILQTSTRQFIRKIVFLP